MVNLVDDSVCNTNISCGYFGAVDGNSVSCANKNRKKKDQRPLYNCSCEMNGLVVWQSHKIQLIRNDIVFLQREKIGYMQFTKS